jgi:hypothetical protein
MICTSSLLSEHERDVPPQILPDDDGPEDQTPRLISDESTMELVVRAQGGDRMATEACRALPAGVAPLGACRLPAVPVATRHQ